jgi:hypothetical protein
MQSSKYDSVTMVRASEDRFSRGRWTQFLYVSRLLSALGVWPFTDNFLSSETDNLLLATLSAGPVGIGDPIDAIDGANLLKAARRDGVIVKPDVPLVPLDSSFLGGATSPNAPMIASTYTDFGRGLRAHYVFAYARGDGGRAVFRLSDLGASGPVYVYDYFSAGGYATEASDTVEDPMGNGRTYLIVAPIGRSGIAVLGDKDHFISLGKKRIAALEDDGAARVSVVFAPGEAARTIFGYSPRPPRVRALAGANGPLQYDPGTRLFTVSVMPGPEGIATISLVQSRPGGGTRLPAARFGSLEP